MKRKCVLVWCLFLTVSAPGQQTKPLTLTGRVIDFNARPIADAAVVCYQLQHKFGKYNLSQGWCSPRSYEPIWRVQTTPDGRFSIQAEKKTFLPAYLVAGKSGLALGWRSIVRVDENIIRLGRPSQFKVTVVDEIARPVQGARVRICLKDKMMMERREIAPLLPEDWFTTKTDANGQFFFDNVPEGATADFGVKAPGRALIWTTCDSGLGQGEQFTAGRTDIRIVLPPEGCIQGRVVKQETDELLAGVQLLARPKNHANRQNYQDQIYSDSNGKFVITGLAPGKHLLQTMSDKEGTGNITVTVEAGQTVSDVKVPLAGHPFEVRVYDAQKEGPLENANVTVTQKHTETKYTSYSQQKTTDANGLALFCAPAGDCEIRVTKLDYGTTLVERYSLTIDPRHTSKQEVSLPRSAIVLSGEVLDEQGHAVSGASVMQTSFGPCTLTDANGHFDTSEFHYFSLRLPSKVTMLARHIQSGLGAIGKLQDPTKSGRPNGRIILKPAYVLTGSVTGPTGKSIPAAYVKLLEGSSNAIVSEVATDPNGFYYIRSVPPPGDKLEYAIVAYAEGFGQSAANQIIFHDDTAQPVQIDPIILLLADEILSGIVMDSNDQPIAGISVSVRGPRIIRNYRELDYGKTLTDEKGRYRITGVPKEPLFIKAWSPSLKQRGETMVNGGNENIRVVLGQNLIFSPSLTGKPLPELKDLKIEISSVDVSDKMLLVCFWDMQQRPSRNCIMRLAKQAEQLKQKGVTVVTVQASEVDDNELNEWVNNYNITFSVGMIQGDGEKTRFDWGVKSLPWLILTNRQHIVSSEGFGIDELDEKLKKNIDTKRTIQKNKAMPAKPVAQTGLSDPAKSFLDAKAILAGWESSYAGIRTMRVSYCTRLVDYQPPANNPDIDMTDLVKYQHVERVEQGNRFYLRYSTAKGGFGQSDSIREGAFDGKITREYSASTKSGSIISGMIGRNTETMNDLKVYMLLRRRLVGGRNASGTYLIEDPNSKPDLSRTLSYAIPRSMISVLPKLESVGSQLCHVVEVVFPGKDHNGIPRQIKQVFWMAHDKGMCLMKYQWYWDSRLDREIEVEKIAVTDMDGNSIWYPQKAYRTLFNEEVGTMKYELTVKDFVPNVEVDEKTFRFDFPKGTYVFDRVRGIAGVDLPKEPGAEDFRLSELDEKISTITQK